MSKLGRSLIRSMRSAYKTEYEKRTGKIDWIYRWHEIKDGFLETMLYSWIDPIRNFKDRIMHVCKWLPILWKDKDWDHWFILEILKQKIRFQREHIRDYGHHTRVKEDCHNMRIAELLIQRIQDDNYSEYLSKKHDEKWGELSWTKKHRLYRPKVKTKEDEIKERAEHKKLWEYEKYMKNQDVDYLFKHLKKYLWHWWD